MELEVRTDGSVEAPGEELPFAPEDLLQELREVPILSTLSQKDMQCLGELHLVRLQKGEVILKQGEAAHFYWIVLGGTLELYMKHPDGQEQVHYELTRGLAFGELPLLANIPNAVSVRASSECRMLRLDEAAFWNLMTVCPEVRKGILQNMAVRLQKLQNGLLQQEKMASLGMMAAGLMHELNNPGSAARRAASQLRENLARMHALSVKFSRSELSREQKQCIWELQEEAMRPREPVRMNSLEQSDAEEALAEWMERAEIANAWKMAPTLVAIGINAKDLECARAQFPGETLADALSWMEAMVSSVQLVTTIEESIGRVSDLVHAVKMYAYEGKGKKQLVDVNESVHATLVILGHKLREKQITVEKELAAGLPPVVSMCTGLNQIWTNLLDNAIDAVEQGGKVQVQTWTEPRAGGKGVNVCVRIADNGAGIPAEVQPRIFDPFYTTKEAGVGTGLGLGIAHRIVEEFGGTIRFASEPGHTEFVVRLPSER
ncbi:MAG: ATP-binding protein [Acidobacteriaceae bacterium]